MKVLRELDMQSPDIQIRIGLFADFCDQHQDDDRVQWLTHHFSADFDDMRNRELLVEILDDEDLTNDAALTKLCTCRADDQLEYMGQSPENYWHESIEHIADDYGFLPEQVAHALAARRDPCIESGHQPWQGFSAALTT